jgi:ADP-dependent NAD(P)H-hydrate dehydratase / NAD(P)H-hydrate epimerase
MRIVTASEMYAIDRYTIQQIGMSEESLMENAGQAAARVLLERISHSERVAVLAGTGNNGGDGFVVARVLKSYGYETDLWLIPPREKVKGAAKKALEIYENAGYEVKYYIGYEKEFAEQLSRYNVVIDALLGIGAKGAPRSPYKDIMEQINETDGLTVYSIDVPSGVPADGGQVETAIQADVTISIQYPKPSAFTFPSADYYGELVVVDIGIPPIAAEKHAATRKLWRKEDVMRSLPRRTLSSHKGTYGKGLVIGGSRNMNGAVVMCAKAALRCGAGLLTIGLPDEIHPIVAVHVPEVMYFPCPSSDGYFAGDMEIEGIDIDAIAVGPGMGRTEGTRSIVEKVLRQSVPVVLDADALFYWKDYVSLVKEREQPTILTPHSGEMARMIDATIREVEEDRFRISKQFAMKYGVYLVLKGPYTIVTTPDGKQFVNATGNPALAKGGSGDVLTGMILSFLMQHEDIQAAVSNAVFVHGKAADVLVDTRHSQLDVLATDVIEAIPHILHSLLK